MNQLREALKGLSVTYISGTFERGILIVSPRSGYMTTLEARTLEEKIFLGLSEIGVSIPVLLWSNIDVTYVTQEKAIEIRDALNRFITQ